MPRVPTRGEVLFPQVKLPPGQEVPHRCVILSPNGFISSQWNGYFVSVAILRSAFSRKGSQVRLVPGHSIWVSASELPFLTNDSIIETHQLFSLPLRALDVPPVGRLPQ